MNLPRRLAFSPTTIQIPTSPLINLRYLLHDFTYLPLQEQSIHPSIYPYRDPHLPFPLRPDRTWSPAQSAILTNFPEPGHSTAWSPPRISTAASKTPPALAADRREVQAHIRNGWNTEKFAQADASLPHETDDYPG